MIIEDVAVAGAAPPTLPKRSPRRTRPASVPVIPSPSQHKSSIGNGVLNRSHSTGSITTMSTIKRGGGAGVGEQRPPYNTVGGPTPDHHLKTEAPRRRDPETQGMLDRMARRGGLYKVILITLSVVGTIVGLAVGLTLGLRKRYVYLYPSTSINTT